MHVLIKYSHSSVRFLYVRLFWVKVNEEKYTAHKVDHEERQRKEQKQREENEKEAEIRRKIGKPLNESTDQSSAEASTEISSNRTRSTVVPLTSVASTSTGEPLKVTKSSPIRNASCHKNSSSKSQSVAEVNQQSMQIPVSSNHKMDQQIGGLIVNAVPMVVSVADGSHQLIYTGQSQGTIQVRIF